MDYNVGCSLSHAIIPSTTIKLKFIVMDEAVGKCTVSANKYSLHEKLTTNLLTAYLDVMLFHLLLHNS